MRHFVLSLKENKHMKSFSVKRTMILTLLFTDTYFFIYFLVLLLYHPR